MKRSSLSILTLAFMSQLSAQTPRFVPGEVMVQFAPGTAGAAALARAIQEDTPTLDRLVPLVSEMADGAGVPLEPQRLASGGWLVLAIDARAVSQRVRDQMIARQYVETAELREQPGQGAATRFPIVMRYASGSPPVDAISQLRAGSRQPFADLLGSLEREVGVPLDGETDGPATLILQVDLGALTMNVVQRLRELPAVQAAQPNYLLRMM